MGWILTVDTAWILVALAVARWPTPVDSRKHENRSGDFEHMKIPDVHIERIRDLGYTESEARFLYLVAVFSGYLTLGQFRTFTGASYGKRPTCFAEKLVGQGHARICGQARRGSVFHLFSRTVYGQMGKDNLRNRKRHSLGFMRTRLALLDFVLANQHLTYFETEQDKVNFFCNELGISKDCLPAKVYEGAAPDQRTIRYFVDKFPLFLASPLPGVPPVVTLSYVDAGFERPPHFASTLATYQPLFRQLSSFRFLYIATQEAYFHGVGERFQSIVRGPLKPDVSNEILRYFRIRRKWENHEYIIPVTEDLEFLRDARLRFRNENMERLFQSWLSGAILGPELLAEISQRKPEPTIFFDTYSVPGEHSHSAGEAGRGDGCMKDTVHGVRHCSRHVNGGAKDVKS